MRIIFWQGFLIELFGVFEDLICSNVYAKNWMIMYMVQNKYTTLCSYLLLAMCIVVLFVFSILVQATTYFTQALCDRFLKGQQFEQQVYFVLKSFELYY